MSGQSYREQGFTDLEIAKIKDEVAQKADQMLALVISRVNNIDAQKNSSVEFKGANTLILRRSTDADIEVKFIRGT